MYEKKIADGFEVLEIPKGTWTEAIFAKAKPKVERHKTTFGIEDEDIDDDNINDEEEITENEDNYSDIDEDDYDEDKLTEESYRTTIDEDPDELSLEAEEVADDDDY